MPLKIELVHTNYSKYIMDQVLDQSIISFLPLLVLQHWDGNEMDPEWPLDHFVEAWNFLNLSLKELFGKTNLK